MHIYIHRGKTADGNWNESDHPRADNGQFGKGSGGGKKAAPAPALKQGGSAPIDTSKPEGQRLASGLLQQATKGAGGNGSGENAILSLKSGGFLRAKNALMHGPKPKADANQDMPRGAGSTERNLLASFLRDANAKSAAAKPAAPSGTDFKEGEKLFSSSFASPRSGTYQGADPDQPKTHALVKFGNSLKAIPWAQLHRSKQEAENQ